jgi:hypothetical protein
MPILSRRRCGQDTEGEVVTPALVLEVQVGQTLPVHQHDLSLGLAEEAEDTHTVKM